MTLVALPRDICPLDGRELIRLHQAEDALLRHGGYGATRETTVLACVCGWSVVAAVSEARPPERAP